MDPFLGEIRIFPYTYAPHGWALCQGQLVSITQNTALYAVLGTLYGGDGIRNFALPNLQGNIPVNAGGGAGPGLQQWQLAEQQGMTAVTLLATQMPAHQHSLQATNGAATGKDPGSSSLAEGVVPNSRVAAPYYANATPNVMMNNQAVATTGGGQAHTNMMPYLVMNFCIALQGIFPMRP